MTSNPPSTQALLNSTALAAIFPPGAVCFANSLQAGNPQGLPCLVTADMIQSLNLSSFKYYFNAYCLNPPNDDGCPYGYCPNPDIAGVFVRISAYVTNFFVAVLLLHGPESLKESFWSQILSVYSLLLTCAWTIIRQELTRIHAILTLAIAGSPLTIYIFVNAVKAWWAGKSRLSGAVGPGKILPRIIVLIALALWTSLIIYVLLPSHLIAFQQESCENQNKVVKFFFFLPVLIVVEVPLWSKLVVTLPILLTLVACLVAVILRRRQIWRKGEKARPHLITAWRVIGDEYPFIHFVAVVVIPTAYWVAAIETGVATGTTHDNHISASFGQVLAVFVAVPPVVSTIKLFPRLVNWFTDLAWVRLITFRPQRKVETQNGIHVVFPGAAENDPELQAYDDKFYKNMMFDRVVVSP